MPKTKRPHEIEIRAQDDAGAWTTLDVDPDEYITLKKAGIKAVRDRRERRACKGDDPYKFIDRLFEMRPERQQILRQKCVDERDYLQGRLEELEQRKAAALKAYDDEIDRCADRLKEMTISIGVLDEVIQDETPGGRRPISELSDDEVPFDDGLAGDNTYFENMERALAEERILASCWPPPGEPVY